MVLMSNDGLQTIIKEIAERNTLILASQIQSGHIIPTAFWLIHPTTFQAVPPRVNNWSRTRKFDDVVAAAIVGAVVLDTKTGADALIVHDGIVKPIELKLSIVEESNYWINENKTIYTGYGDSGNSRTSLRSNISGSFSHIGNAEEKRRLTYLVVMVDGPDPVVGAWMLDGDKVFEFLTSDRRNSKVHVAAFRSKAEIKLSTFLIHGSSIETTIESSGLDALEQRIRKNAQSSPYARGEPAPPKRTKLKKEQKLKVDSSSLVV